MADKLKLSELIRLGCQVVPEEKGTLIRKWSGDGWEVCGACAIGAALVAKRGTVKADLGSGYWQAIAELGFPREIIERASIRHFNGMTRSEPRLTREQIADLVEEWGY